MKKLIVLGLGLMGLLACKKIISVDINNAEPALVIEGNINDQMGPQQIKLSKSIAIESEADFPAVSGAQIKVSDNLGNSFLFIETKPGIYMNNMRGIWGRTYTMNVKVGDREYTAQSTMPKPVRLDSLTIKTSNFFGKERKGVLVHFVDPPAVSNYYKFFMYINNRLIKNIFVVNDRLSNGNKIQLQLFYNGEDIDSLKRNDMVDVEMQSIDSKMYDYWYSLSQQNDRGPSQGTTPSNPPSNISNGALGYFCAGTYEVKSIIVK